MITRSSKFLFVQCLCWQLLLIPNFAKEAASRDLNSQPVPNHKANAAAGQSSQPLSYARYLNPRFKYGIDYPTFLLPGPEPENGDGLKFSSADQKTELTVYGYSAYATVDGAPWTLRKLLEESLSNRKKDGYRVTYQRMGKDWFVISGHGRDRVFYFKAMIHDDNVKCFEFVYPADQRQRMGPIVLRVGSSFRNTL